MLTSRISPLLPLEPTSEDIFSSSVSLLFTDDTQSSHGIPGSTITYRSPAFGDITLKIPVHPDEDERRKLFAHYLWNAAVVMAEGLERGSCSGRRQVGDAKATRERDSGKEDQDPWFRNPAWDVRGERVLELGAGTALPSLIAALSGASACTITDHPSSPSLTSDTIAANVKAVLLSTSSQSAQLDKLPHPPPSYNVTIRGYVWGERVMYDTAKYGKPAAVVSLARTTRPTTTPVDEEMARYDRILLADCLWMPSQHRKLRRTLLHFLSRRDDADLPDSDEEKGAARSRSSPPCAIVVAGYHTGRSTVRDFFDIAVASSAGDEDDENMEGEEGEQKGQHEGTSSRLCIAAIFEIDVDGKHREWARERPGESRNAAKRWCVVAILLRHTDSTKIA